MNELSNGSIQLPDSIEDLSKFVLIGREKLNAVRAEIRAIQKVGLAKEVHEQKLHEAQEIAEAVLDAEVKIGELTARIEKAAKGTGSNQYKKAEIDNAVEFSKPKSQTLKEIGIPQHTAERFERMARHPETVQRAKEEARAEGKIVTRQDVLNRIVVPSKTPHSIKSVIKQAAEEHEAFKEEKKSGIVNMESMKRDKENIELVLNNTKLRILKAARSASDLIVLNTGDVNELASNISKEESEELCNSLSLAIDTLIMVREIIERRGK